MVIFLRKPHLLLPISSSRSTHKMIILAEKILTLIEIMCIRKHWSENDQCSECLLPYLRSTVYSDCKCILGYWPLLCCLKPIFPYVLYSIKCIKFVIASYVCCLKEVIYDEGVEAKRCYEHISIYFSLDWFDFMNM